jgi:flagellar hook-associated protein 1 FlgK
MAKISSLMDMGRRGMMLSQTALNTTSHNISNKSTEGYSRQRVDVVTNPAVDEGRYRSGTGARLGGINRINNPWLEKQLEQEGSQYSFLDSKANALTGLENVINEQNVEGINASISNFFNSFRDLANNPESAVPRTQVREAASSLVSVLKTAKQQIDAAAEGIGKSIEAGLEEVNGYGKEIAQLNEKILNVEISGGQANDERDRRDLLVKKLSEKMNISYAEDPKTGMLNVTAGKTAVLVAGTSSTQIYATQSEFEGPRVMYNLSQGSSFDVTDQFVGGSLGASLSVAGANGEVGQLGQHLEDMAYNIASEVNKIHQEGFDRYNGQGVQFFDMNQKNGFSIANMSLNKEILKDVGLIAAASQANSPGDNNVALVLQNLQFQKVMGDGQYTFDNFYNSKVGEIGLVTKGTLTALESQKNTVDQLKNTRESISGVNLDEEASKMMEFQKSFEASARMIRVADEMFDTVLNLKRL